MVRVSVDDAIICAREDGSRDKLASSPDGNEREGGGHSPEGTLSYICWVLVFVVVDTLQEVNGMIS